MSRNVKCEHLPNGTIRLIRDFGEVPRDFTCDGASVPRFFWRLVFPPGDTQALRAAFLHDYIYRTHPAGWDRKKADDLFYDVLVADGVPKRRAYLAWAGVRRGGAAAWDAGGKHEDP